MKLFTVAKVGLYCDVITHGTEKRDGDEVKIVTLALRVQPFDAKLATAVSHELRTDLFKLNHPDPKPMLRRVDFALGCERQKLLVYIAPDAAGSRIAFDQVKITGTYARTEKNVNGYAFCFKASFGPLGREELAFVCDWHLQQRFVTFEEAEPGFFDDEPEEASDPPAQPAPMFDDDGNQPAAAADKETKDAKKEPARQRLHSHAKKSSKGKRKK